MLPRIPQGRDMGPNWKLSSPNAIRRSMMNPENFDNMSPEAKQAYINSVHAIELNNKQQYDATTAPTNDVQIPVQQTVESGFKTVAQKLKEEKKERDKATLRRAVIMKLKEQGNDHPDNSLINEKVGQLQTSCKLTGINDEVKVKECVETLTFSQNGARRRNRTKHRRSRHKRTRRYRKN